MEQVGADLNLAEPELADKETQEEVAGLLRHLEAVVVAVPQEEMDQTVRKFLGLGVLGFLI